jgi:hypothetical protein
MKHWKRILSALLIGAMALTLFAGCDKKVKVEDELFKQVSDFYQTKGQTVEKSPDNSDAEKLMAYIEANYTPPTSSFSSASPFNSYMTRLRSNVVLPTVYGIGPTDYVYYTVGWSPAIPNPQSEYYKSSSGIVAKIMNDIFISASTRKITFNNTASGVKKGNTEYFSYAQGEVDGITYYLVVLRCPAVTTT